MDISFDFLNSFNTLISSLHTADERCLEGLEHLKETLKISKYKSYTPIIEFCIDSFIEHKCFPEYNIIRSGFSELIGNRDIGEEITVNENYLTNLNRALDEVLLRDNIQHNLSSGNIENIPLIIEQSKRGLEEEHYDENDAYKEYLAMLDMPSGILTNIDELDELIKSYSYGTMNAVCAPPRCYKTTMAISTAYNAIQMGFNVQYISLEMMRRDLWFSFLSRHSYEIGTPLDASKMKKALLTEEEVKILKNVTESFKELKGELNIIPASSLRALDYYTLKETCKAKSKGKFIDVIIFDYIQLARTFHDTRDSLQEYYNKVTSGFTRLTTDLNGGKGTIGVLLSQINRQGEIKINKRGYATFEDIAEVNAVERDATTVTVLFSTAPERENSTTRFQLIKNRNGPDMSEMLPTFVNPINFIVGGSGKAVVNEEAFDVLNEENVEGDIDGFTI